MLGVGQNSLSYGRRLDITYVSVFQTTAVLCELHLEIIK